MQAGRCIVESSRSPNGLNDAHKVRRRLELFIIDYDWADVARSVYMPISEATPTAPRSIQDYVRALCKRGA